MDENLFYEKLNNFLSFDICDFSPLNCVKGKFIHDEFCLFLRKNNILAIPGIRAFYELIRMWIIKQKDPAMQIKEHNYSKTIYFLGISIKGKHDDSKEKYDKYMREKRKEIRHEKAENEGRIIFPRKTYDRKLNKIYVTELPKDSHDWNQYRITIENFDNWYSSFLKDPKEEDLEESESILNEALNNFRHAKELKPKKFNIKSFEALLHHAEDTLETLRDSLNKDEEK